MATLLSVTDDATQELADRLRDGDYSDVSDLIAEIADSAVPVYHSDLLEVAGSDFDLILTEPEGGPAYDGSATPLNLIAANVYEAVSAALWEALPDLEAEIEEEKEADES